MEGPIHSLRGLEWEYEPVKDLVVVFGEDQIFPDHVRAQHEITLPLFSICSAVEVVEDCVRPTSSDCAVLGLTHRRKKIVLSGPGHSLGKGANSPCSCSWEGETVGLHP